MDLNGDGLVSKAELKAHMQKKGGSLALVEQLISTLDTDGDGQISKDEFLSLAM